MKKEIKFRAFHKRENEMMEGEASDIFRWEKEGQPIEIMQYTGLNDKNGKEIYEGDIFRHTIEEDHGDVIQYSVVMWINQRAAFYLIPVVHMNILDDNNCEEEKEFEWLFDQAALYDFNLDVKHSTIVGNIYQNPELTNP